MGDSGGGNVACDEAETTGNGAVDGWDDAALPVAGLPADRAEPRPRLHGVPARRVTGTSYTGHSHSRLDHASALANRNAMTAASSRATATPRLAGYLARQPPSVTRVWPVM